MKKLILAALLVSGQATAAPLLYTNCVVVPVSQAKKLFPGVRGPVLSCTLNSAAKVKPLTLLNPGESVARNK